MQWEDERWVKVYTNDTPDWASIDWEARAVFNELLRKVNRAGVMPLGKTKLRGVAALLRIPADVVERSVATLVDDGCVVVTGSHIVIRNFIQAQEAKTSEAMRKRSERERSRDMASANDDPELAKLILPTRDAPDTLSGKRGFSDNLSGKDEIPDSLSGKDGNADKKSRSVTPCHAQKRREEKREEENRQDQKNTEPPEAPARSAGVSAGGFDEPSGDTPCPPGPEDHPAGKKDSRGTRISPDWRPSKKTLEWCAAEGVEDPLSHVDAFFDFWNGKPGKDGRKLDWDGTFKNRIRDLIRYGHIGVLPVELRPKSAAKAPSQPELFGEQVTPEAPPATPEQIAELDRIYREAVAAMAPPPMDDFDDITRAFDA
jgi:hypothetical protein